MSASNRQDINTIDLFSWDFSNGNTAILDCSESNS